MKHLTFAVSLVFVVSISLSACGDGESTEEVESTATETQQPEETAVEVPGAFPDSLWGFVLNPETDPMTLTEFAEHKGYLAAYIMREDNDLVEEGRYIMVKAMFAKAQEIFPIDYSAYKPTETAEKKAEIINVGGYTGWMTYSKISETATYTVSINDSLQVSVELLGGEWKPEDMDKVLKELNLDAFKSLTK